MADKLNEYECGDEGTAGLFCRGLQARGFGGGPSQNPHGGESKVEGTKVLSTAPKAVFGEMAAAYAGRNKKPKKSSEQ